VSATETVFAWHEALNAGDADRLAALSDPDVEVGGPRGQARGRQVLKDWVGRANVTLAPLRSFHSGRNVVVEEAATWRGAETGETIGEATVATVFKVEGGLVAAVVRHDSLEDALQSVGLEGSDSVRPE
jgi:ketosteroid isomerase-like protein